MIVTCCSVPISPAATRSRSARNEGSKRRLKPIITSGFRSRISAQQAEARAKSRSIGFSHSTALPARAAAVISGTCVSVEVAISTACTAGSASTASTLSAWRAPSSAVVSAAAAAAMS